MNEAFRELYKHNLWANLRLLDVCERLDATHLERTVVGTYGSIHDTFVHLVSAEGRYVARLTDQQPDESFGERIGFTSWEDLRERVRQSGEALITVAEDFDAAWILRGVRNGEAYVIPAMVQMIQVINHATEHRVQIAAILTQVGVEPPTLDGWQYGEEEMPVNE